MSQILTPDDPFYILLTYVAKGKKENKNVFFSINQKGPLTQDLKLYLGLHRALQYSQGT